MKSIKSALFVLLCISSSAFPQTDRQPPQQTDNQARQGSGGARQSAAIDVIYDKSKDETTVKTKAIPLFAADTSEPRDEAVEMFLIYTFPSSAQKSAVDHALIAFSSRAQQFKFRDNYKVAILADGQVIIPANQLYDDRSVENMPKAGVVEHIGVTMTLEQVESIAQAQRVVIEIGNYKYTLRPRQINLFKAFAARMSNAASQNRSGG